VQSFGTGIVIEASGVSLTNLNVASNVAQGILVNNTSNVLIDNITSTANGAAGLELAQSTGVIVRGAAGALEENGTYGLWVHSSSNNQFLEINTTQNGRAGIYVKESGNDQDAQPDSYTDARVAPSQHNVFLSGDTVVNTGDGIRIGASDTGNFVVDMTGYDNTGTDAADENGNCTSNTWTDNSFHTKNPSCIQ
jgi:parallel beta-helix repeat protein